MGAPLKLIVSAVAFRRSVRRAAACTREQNDRARDLDYLKCMNAVTALDKQIERYRQMSGEQRLAVALDLHELSCESHGKEFVGRILRPMPPRWSGCCAPSRADACCMNERELLVDCAPAEPDRRDVYLTGSMASNYWASRTTPISTSSCKCPPLRCRASCRKSAATFTSRKRRARSARAAASIQCHQHALLHGNGTSKSLQIFRAMNSMISRCRGMAEDFWLGG